MEVKLLDLVQSENVLATIAQSRFNLKTTYNLTKLIRVVAPEIKNFQEARLKYFEQYGEVKEDGSMEIKPEHSEMFKKEIAELLEGIVNIPVNHFTFEEFKDLSITPNDFRVVEWMFNLDEQETVKN
jgi:hypothetical protein